MSCTQYKTIKVNLHDKGEKADLGQFLEEQGLELEDDIEFSLTLRDPETDEVVATGSFSKNVLKCIAVKRNRTGEGLSARVLTELIKEQFVRGRNHLFVFTKPENVDEGIDGGVFTGFTRTAETYDMVLLEFGSETVNDYGQRLSGQRMKLAHSKTGVVSSIIMNCNPFTSGHQYLIETASKESDVVYVIMVSEDKSVFPHDVRLDLIRKGTAHLDNVRVLEGEQYVISPATFPRYFMKTYDDIALSQARLDVTLFAEHIVPSLGINRRYVGEEPYCPVTQAYNEAMNEILGNHGVDLKVIPRRHTSSGAISASTVRRLIKEGKMDEIKEIVPATTYDFITSDSPEAKAIIAHIKSSNGRH